MHHELYPLTFTPMLRHYLWGGRNLERLYGRTLPEGITAESWEISGHASAPTTVDAGPWQGRTLPELLGAFGERLVGRRGGAMLARGRFPLLIKLLDAHNDLSVQVHPTDAYALAHEDDLGKTEAWVILHAEPGAELIYGLAPGTTPASFAAALAANNLAPQLQRLPVTAGDAIFVPAGTVHAILAGVVAAEIQQNSDATYRVYDWGRKDNNGQARPLHISQALEVIDWRQIAPGKARPESLARAKGLEHARLVQCPEFAIERVTLTPGGAFASACQGDTFEIWGCVQGSAKIEWAGAPVALDAVRFCLLPADLGRFAVRAQAAATLLRIYLPA